MHKLLPLILLICFLASIAFANSDLISVKSSHDVKTTADRFESALREKGMTVFIRINHTEGAKKIGASLRPTELLIFGNPKVGTPLMQCGQSVAIDLPQKALIWEDEAGQVWFSYNDPRHITDRHGLTGCTEVLKRIEEALSNFAKMATMP